MTTYRRGSVVLLPFPFTDLSAIKRRPSVVISTEVYNARRPDLIVAPISSQIATRQVGDCVLGEWAAAGLVKPSLVKGILGTVEQTQVIRVLGCLSEADLRAVESAVAEALGLSPPASAPVSATPIGP